ncbi:DUF397 domain-containing protein [Streptomyces sp. NPDC052496]|uniref:DUF397 domain-containing protein n=1 Tax=Streptomyces sp. NPDC052496 TaxID=3154951 RepID=UPI00344563BC
MPLRRSFGSTGPTSARCSFQGECVEITTAPGAIRVRDSVAPKDPQLAFGAGAWAAFLPYACDDGATPG